MNIESYLLKSDKPLDTLRLLTIQQRYMCIYTCRFRDYRPSVRSFSSG